MLKGQIKTIIISSKLASLPIQNSFAETTAIETLADFNDGFIFNSSQHSLNLKGVNSINTFQKGNAIILQVEHNPKVAYKMLVNKTLTEGARINGLNFQNSFTLGITEQYCNRNLFRSIGHLGYSDTIQINYTDESGHLVKRHKISQNLCRSFS